MKPPHNWQALKRHPLSAEYQDLHGQAWADFVADMHRVGYLADRPIVLHERKVLDGWQRLRGAIEALVEPTFARLPEGVDPEDYLSAINDHRRHMGQEQARTKAEARRERVMRARAEGKSIRAIAGEEGVSVGTVHGDVAASGVQPIEHLNGAPVVTGKDGKPYPAARAQTADDENDGADDPPDYPARLAKYFDTVDLFRKAIRKAREAANLFRECEKTPTYKLANAGPHTVYSSYLELGARDLEQMTPHGPCPECGGSEEPSPDADMCHKCEGRGFLTVEQATEQAA